MTDKQSVVQVYFANEYEIQWNLHHHSMVKRNDDTSQLYRYFWEASCRTRCTLHAMKVCVPCARMTCRTIPNHSQECRESTTTESKQERLLEALKARVILSEKFQITDHRPDHKFYIQSYYTVLPHLFSQ